MARSVARKVRLKLPATSANLGPGFDTAALALAMHLEIEAEPAERFSIDATGYGAHICAQLEGNLLLKTYEQALAAEGRIPQPLAITMRNGIPLGMGCGSSAATRLAALALASIYGALDWSRERILVEAALLEGHPDNAAACWLGGFAVAAMCAMSAMCDRGTQIVAYSAPPPQWHALVAMPLEPLATTTSRRVLPEQYARRDVVYNLQRVALLTAAFTSGRADLLGCATGDALHQPYRSEVCPLLGKLLPLVGQKGILSVSLSGAGPAVLLLLASEQDAPAASAAAEQAAREVALAGILSCKLEPNPATYTCS